MFGSELENKLEKYFLVIGMHKKIIKIFEQFKI